MDDLEKDELGLFINAPYYAQQRAKMVKIENRQKAWKALPWWKKLWYQTFAWKKYVKKYIMYYD